MSTQYQTSDVMEEGVSDSGSAIFKPSVDPRVSAAVGHALSGVAFVTGLDKDSARIYVQVAPAFDVVHWLDELLDGTNKTLSFDVARYKAHAPGEFLSVKADTLKSAVAHAVKARRVLLQNVSSERALGYAVKSFMGTIYRIVNGIPQGVNDELKAVIQDVATLGGMGFELEAAISGGTPEELMAASRGKAGYSHLAGSIVEGLERRAVARVSSTHDMRELGVALEELRLVEQIAFLSVAMIMAQDMEAVGPFVLGIMSKVNAGDITGAQEQLLGFEPSVTVQTVLAALQSQMT